jgi:hypothetical protein
VPSARPPARSQRLSAARRRLIWFFSIVLFIDILLAILPQRSDGDCPSYFSSPPDRSAVAKVMLASVPLPSAMIRCNSSAIGPRYSECAIPVPDLCQAHIVHQISHTSKPSAALWSVPARRNEGSQGLFPAPSFGTGVIRARATVTHDGRSVAVSASEAFDADGKKVAVAPGSAVDLTAGVPAEQRERAMAYGHAEHDLALICRLEAETQGPARQARTAGSRAISLAAGQSSPRPDRTQPPTAGAAGAGRLLHGSGVCVLLVAVGRS